MAEQKKNDTVSKDEKKERVRQEFLELRRTGDPKLRNKLITDHLYIAEILAKNMSIAELNSMIFIRWHRWD